MVDLFSPCSWCILMHATYSWMHELKHYPWSVADRVGWDEQQMIAWYKHTQLKMDSVSLDDYSDLLKQQEEYLARKNANSNENSNENSDVYVIYRVSPQANTEKKQEKKQQQEEDIELENSNMSVVSAEEASLEPDEEKEKAKAVSTEAETVVPEAQREVSEASNVPTEAERDASKQKEKKKQEKEKKKQRSKSKTKSKSNSNAKSKSKSKSKTKQRGLLSGKGGSSNDNSNKSSASLESVESGEFTEPPTIETHIETKDHKLDYSNENVMIVRPECETKSPPMSLPKTSFDWHYDKEIKAYDELMDTKTYTGMDKITSGTTVFLLGDDEPVTYKIRSYSGKFTNGDYDVTLEDDTRSIKVPLSRLSLTKSPGLYNNHIVMHSNNYIYCFCTCIYA